jgi:hypothetical protein
MLAASDLGDLVWSRGHGEEKRELVVCEILRREGYAAQCTPDRRGHAGRRAGSTPPRCCLSNRPSAAPARAGAMREEVHVAMEDLVRGREAVRIPDRDGIIIRRGL